ncbi:MAG: DUF2207 domain-containing protein [Pseudomonadota bacterium]
MIFLVQLTSISIAEEVINNFEVKVILQKDGTLEVTEEITVTSEGRKIRRGIFRDFPLLFEDTDGVEKQVGFELLETLRDGRRDNNRIERSRNRARIYIGKKDRFLKAGQYKYTIRYRTDRQIRFFENYDELFWNVTGNFWDFPILKTTAVFFLPDGVRPQDVIGFTGRVGSTEQAVRITSATTANTVNATATRKLNLREGLSVAIKMPKGSINQPSEAQKSAWFWQDNKSLILGSGSLIVIMLYYFATWWRIGRDPPSGAIVPRWDIPDGISPALVNYIHRKGLAGKGFDAISAAVLNLAVKGLVILDKDEGGFLQSDTLHITATDKNPPASLPVGEAAILKHVKLGLNNSLEVSSGNGPKVKLLQESFASAMEKEHRNKFYQHNYIAVVIGVILSLSVLAITLIQSQISDGTVGVLAVGGFLTAIVSSFLISLGKNFLRPGKLIGKLMSLIFIGFFSFGISTTGLFVTLQSIVSEDVDTVLITIVVGIVVLNILFYFLLGAPTTLGRKRMDEIEGLRTYLSLAEKDRMNMVGAPDFSTQHYEDLLPYAVALGVEKPWSKAFETWLAAAVAAGAVAASYTPSWYRGSDFNSGRLSDTMDGFSSSMQSGFSSAMPAPKSSSSGFSGGGSGGGGGGGGGGGW